MPTRIDRSIVLYIPCRQDLALELLLSIRRSCASYSSQGWTSTCLQLTNLTDGFVAFKIKTNQGKYSTQPNKGIMEPCSRCYIAVTLRAQEAAPLNMQCNDMFIVESANVREEITSDEITEGFFQDDQVMAGKVEELPIVYIAAN